MAKHFGATLFGTFLFVNGTKLWENNGNKSETQNVTDTVPCIKLKSIPVRRRDLEKKKNRFREDSSLQEIP